MQHWLKFGVLIPLLALLCFGGNARAQEQSSSGQTIYIQTILLFTELELGSITKQILDSVNENLAPYDLRVEKWTETQEASPQLTLITSRQDDGSFRTMLSFFPRYTVIEDQLHLQSLALVHRYAPLVMPDYILDWDSENADHMSTVVTNMVIGFVLYFTGNCNVANDYFENANYRQSPNVFADFYMGNCAIINGDIERAISLFEPILVASQPNDAVLYYFGVLNNLAWSYIQVGREEAAFELMGYVVETGNSTEIPYYLSQRAQLYALASRDDEALADFNTAIELAPDDANAYFYRGVFFYTRADYPAALGDFTRYLELAPHGDHVDDAATYIEEIEQLNNAGD